MKSENENFTVPAINLEYQAIPQKNPVYILLIIIVKQALEFKSIQSLCQFIFPVYSVPCYEKKQRNLVFSH